MAAHETEQPSALVPNLKPPPKHLWCCAGMPYGADRMCTP